MKTHLLAAAAPALFLAAALPAAATTYVADRAVGNGSVTLSITTDDTIGTLTQANIVDWTIGLTQGADKFTLTKSNSQLLLFGSGLSATAKDLLFDFSANQTFALFQAPTTGSAQTFYCVEGVQSGCAGFPTSESLLASTDYNKATFTKYAGSEVIASVAGVPEPATWALMILGFGAVGGAIRRRQSVTAKVRFA